MDGKRVFNKCGWRDDRISCLPEDIIVYILSFLPSKEAAASTSLVSRRWLHLWKHTPNLRLKFLYNNNNDSNINRVNTALKLHKAQSLQELRIELVVEKSDHDHVAKWLEYAFSRRVESLDLILHGIGSIGDCLNCVVLDQDMLKEIVGNGNCSFKSLKVLCLRSFPVRGEAVGFFLRNCSSLERLVIYRVPRRSDLEVVGPSLKHLDMRSRSLMNKSTDMTSNPYFREDYSIKVCAPNLTWLTIDQNSEVLFLEHVPNLVNLHFYCRFQLGDTIHHFKNVATQLVTLIIHLYEPDSKITFSVPEMPKLKKLVVYFRSNFHRVPLPVTHFLCASPSLEEFKLDISELYLESGVSAFEVGPPCPHRHLKLFVLSGYWGVTRFLGLDYSFLAVSLDLIRYVVDNCVGLEEIVVGRCDPVGLVRDIVDSYDSLDDVIVQPKCIGSRRNVASPQEQEDFHNMMQRQQIPAHIKLRIVFEEH